MSAASRARDVLEHLIDGISNRRWQELHELYAENAVIDYPFALPARTRLGGREAIQRYFATVARLPLELRAHDVVMHETTDPEVVIVEYEYDGLVTTTGRSFEVSNIQVSRVRHAQIVESRDYHNHLLLADAIGRLPELVSAFTNRDSA